MKTFIRSRILHSTTFAASVSVLAVVAVAGSGGLYDARSGAAEGPQAVDQPVVIRLAQTETKDATESDESKEMMNSDESKEMMNSGESKEMMKPDESKEMMNSDESKEMMKSDESKEMMKSDESKEMMKSDESKEMMKSDESKEMMNSDESKEMMKSDESKEMMKSDESKEAAEPMMDESKKMMEMAEKGDRDAALALAKKLAGADEPDNQGAAKYAMMAIAGGGQKYASAFVPNTRAWTRDFWKALQTQLKNAGAYKGAIDGLPGRGTQYALMTYAGIQVPKATPNRVYRNQSRQPTRRGSSHN